jgi:hypothetical protein
MQSSNSQTGRLPGQAIRCICAAVFDLATEDRVILGWNRRPLHLAGGDQVPGISRVVVDARQAWTRAQPAFVADLSEGGVQHTLFACSLVRHAKFVSQFQRCALFGSHHFHAVLQDNGTLSLHDTDFDRVKWRVEFYLARDPGPEVVIPRIEAQDGGFVCTTSFLGESDVVRIAEPVFFGSPVEPDNYGMWLIMGLPSAHDFVRRAHGGRYLCWIRSAWQRKLLNFMGIPDEQIVVQEPWRIYDCSSLTMHQYSHVDVTPTPSDRGVFEELRERCMKGEHKAFEKIFVSRRSFTDKVGYRKLLNEAELINALEARGFVTVEPEMLDFQAQVRIFASARVVVGLGGAAMFNAVFCKPGAAIVSIEGSPAFTYGHSNLFAASQLDFGFIFGKQDQSDPTPTHKRWSVNVPEAMRYVDAFI